MHPENSPHLFTKSSNNVIPNSTSQLIQYYFSLIHRGRIVPDTSRSTGAYIRYVYGSLVGESSFVPNPVALSSAEAEYNACSFAIMASMFSKQVFNTFSSRNPESPSDNSSLR